MKITCFEGAAGMSEGSKDHREEAGTSWRAQNQEGGPCGERDEYVVPVYVAFEGGGARGVAHVGALRALENPTELPPDNANDITDTPVGTSMEGRFEILGTAGTSAGAIMAALVAAGYTSDELLSEDGGDSLLKRLGFTSMTELFGKGRWWQVRALRWATSHLRDSAIFFLVSILFIVALSESFVPHVSVVWSVIIAGLVVVSVFWVARHMAAGLCPTKKVRDTLNVALARKLGFDDRHSVTFEDLCGKWTHAPPRGGQRGDGRLVRRLHMDRLTTASPNINWKRSKLRRSTTFR